jgi:hypothetical protein
MGSKLFVDFLETRAKFTKMAFLSLTSLSHTWDPLIRLPVCRRLPFDVCCWVKLIPRAASPDTIPNTWTNDRTLTPLVKMPWTRLLCICAQDERTVVSISSLTPSFAEWQLPCCDRNNKTHKTLGYENWTDFDDLHVGRESFPQIIHEYFLTVRFGLNFLSYKSGS